MSSTSHGVHAYRSGPASGRTATSRTFAIRTRIIAASLASHNRAAFSATTSKHRLNIRRRAGDDAQEFHSSRSAAPSFGEIAVAFEFFEQPHVLDGDDGLVGEGFEQLDLRRGEGAHLGATCAQRSNEFPLLTKGNGQEGAAAAGGTHHWEIVLRADVGNVERAMLAHPAILWLIHTDLDAAN